MQRYNPLYRIIDTIIQEKILGEFLHGFFENYASGESVHTGHWMWEKSKSGGIFIEHAVHFFDMFEGWFGKGEVITSQKVWYPGNKKEAWTQVQSIVDYDGCPVNFYHGFNQPGRLDRQEIRLLFEKGDVSLYEWIPVYTRLHGLVDETDLGKLKKLFPVAEIEKVNGFTGESRRCRGHYHEYDVSCEIILEDGKPEDKLTRYQQMLEYMLEDQIKWIKNREHQPVISGLNGLNSLKMAFDSEQLAIEL
jgi:predicted dehydrogenase